MIHFEYAFVLASLVGVFAYLIGYGRGAKFTLDEFDKQFDRVTNKGE